LDENNEILQQINLDLAQTNQVQDILIQIEITKLETALVKNITNLTVTEKALKILEKEYADKQNEFENSKIEYERISRELSLAQQAYNTYQEMHKEALTATTSELGKTSVIISSYAEASNAPVSPNKTLNMAIGLVLGLMLGVFYAFFKHMWSAEEK
jgi:uncharacterized protein involved in exopolysaccharide biosynthesis